MTLQELFGIKHAKDSDTNIINQALANANVVENLKFCSTLMVNEVSLFSWRLFKFINKIAQRARNGKRPFGGMQLVFCGDFHQLPPVPNNPFDNGDFCFLLPLWKVTVLLKSQGIP